jgi:hypothetical protein
MTRLIVAVALAAVLLAPTGCNKFTRQRYETIYVGQPVSQVEEFLGKPDYRSEGDLIYVNRRPYYRAVIHTKDGKVSGKHWSVEKSQQPCGCK